MSILIASQQRTIPIPLLVRNDFTPPLGENKDVLKKALMVLGSVFGEHGQVLRVTAMKTLIDSLGLADYVKANPAYTDINRAAAVIVSSLCKNGLLTRWMCPRRYNNRSRETTKGYILTPLGREKLNEWCPNTSLPDSPEKETITLAKVEANLTLIQPLLDEYDKIQQESKEFDPILLELEEKKCKIQNEIDSFKELQNEEFRKLNEIRTKIKAFLA